MIKNTKFYNIYFLSLVYFLFAYLIAVSWHNKSYFAVFDILFQTDPNINLITFAHGWGRHAITHAFIEFFAIPFRVLSYLAAQLNLIENERDFRDLLGLTVSPFMSALTLIVVYKMLSLLNISRFEKNAITLIFALSFSNLVFSIIPETYAISCFFISVLFYFYIKESCSTLVDYKYWIVIGFLLTGTSITNVCIFGIIFLFSLHINKKYTLLKSLFYSGLVSFVVLLSVVGLYEFVHFLMDYPKGNAGNSDWIKKYMASDFQSMLHNFVSLGSASISSFFPANFYVESSLHCAKENLSCNQISFQNGSITPVAMIKTMLLMLLMALAYLRAPKDNKALTILCIRIVLFNFALHAVMGDEMFLYAQHWILPLVLLLIPLFSSKKIFIMLFLLLQCIFNMNFFLLLEKMIAMA